MCGDAEKHMTLLEYEELCDENAGVCLACLEYTYGVEPDARNYKCDECGEFMVMGVEFAMVSGNIVFDEEKK